MNDQTETQELPQNLSLTLAVPSMLDAHISQGNDLLATANDFVVDCHEMATLAAQQMTGCKKFAQLMEAGRKDFLEPAQLIIERAKKWFNPPLQAALEAETIYKKKLMDWGNAETKRIALENMQREEEARRIRQEAEAKAASERAKAKEIARQKEAEAQAAALQRAQAEQQARVAAEAKRRAIEEGNKEAARLEAEKEREAREQAQRSAASEAKASEQAVAAVETGEANAQTAQLQAAVAVTNTAPLTQQKVDGAAVRKHWIAKLAPNTSENAAKLLIAEMAVKGRHDLLALFELNMSAANKLAKAYESSFSVPGMVAVNEPIIVGSSR